MSEVNYLMLPEHMQDGARLYVERGVEPGGFLMAVLSNNLVEAFARADQTNAAEMDTWVCWLYTEAPRDCWGSPGKVAASA